MEEEASAEEEEEDRERGEGDMAFLGEGDDLRGVSGGGGGKGGGRAYDGFPASNPQRKHGGVVKCGQRIKTTTKTTTRQE